MATSEELNRYARPLIGRHLLAVEKKDYSWFFTFDSEASIATEEPWRLFNECCIVVASEDHGHPFGLPAPVDAAAITLSMTQGRVIKAASICARSGDLTIDFDGPARLQFLQLSSGYESWRLSAQGSNTICTGSGAITHFSNSEIV